MYSTTATEQLQRRLKAALARLERLREEAAEVKDPWAPTSPVEALWEARQEVAYLRRALSMVGRRWRCELCGEEYGPEWVAASGLRCHVECDGWLVEVRNG
jgi:hypothetical protein